MHPFFTHPFANIFSGELVYALGWTILHSFWQCALIASLLALGLHSTKNLSSNARYLLAYTALLLCFFISLITFHSYWEQAKAARITLTLEALGLQLPHTMNVQSLFQQWLASADRFLIWIVVVWLVGCACMSLRGLLDFYSCVRLQSSAQDAAPAHWLQTLTQLRARTKVTQAVRLHISDRIVSPCTLGHFKPVILLPVGLLTSMSQEHIEIILLHELGHIRRNDYAFGLVQMLLKILFFFNPMALWISSVIDAERENACDDIAMDICQNPMMFSQALQEFVAMNHHKITTSTTMAMAGKKMKLLNRIKRQFTHRSTMSQAVEKAIAAGVLLLSCAAACVYAQTNSPELPEAQEQALITSYQHLPAFAKLSSVEQQSVVKRFLAEYDSQVFNTGITDETRLLADAGAVLEVENFSDPLKRKITINPAMLSAIKASAQLNLHQGNVTLFKDETGNSVIALEKASPLEKLPPLKNAYKTSSLNNKFFVSTNKYKNWKDDPADLIFKVSYQYLFIVLSPSLIDAAISNTPKNSQTAHHAIEAYSYKSLVPGAPYAGCEKSVDGNLVITYDRTAWDAKSQWMHESQLFENSPANVEKSLTASERTQKLADLSSQLDDRRGKLILSQEQFSTLSTCFQRHFGFEMPARLQFKMQENMLQSVVDANEQQLQTIESQIQEKWSHFRLGAQGDEFYINLLNPDFTTCDRKVN